MPNVTPDSPRWTQVALGLVLLGVLLAAGPVLAQTGDDSALTDEDATLVDASELRSADELDELVGPIALYPDDLLAIVLPASTYPLQIVQAARFLDQAQDDPALQPDEDWDESVVALLNYPEVLRRMNEDLDWTWALGDAVVNQESEVLAAVAHFRDKAYTAGNLQSDDHQVVRRVDEVIEIEPADPKVIYVPDYQPERVVVYHHVPAYGYYPRPYPVYYYPYPAGYSFYDGWFWGVTSVFTIGWSNYYLSLYPYSYPSHPYYGHRYYYDRYYYRRPLVIVNNLYPPSYRYDDYHWRPRHHYYQGARPVERRHWAPLRYHDNHSPRDLGHNDGRSRYARPGGEQLQTRSHAEHDRRDGGGMRRPGFPGTTGDTLASEQAPGHPSSRQPDSSTRRPGGIPAVAPARARAEPQVKRSLASGRVGGTEIRQRSTARVAAAATPRTQPSRTPRAAPASATRQAAKVPPGRPGLAMNSGGRDTARQVIRSPMPRHAAAAQSGARGSASPPAPAPRAAPGRAAPRPGIAYGQSSGSQSVRVAKASPQSDRDAGAARGFRGEARNDKQHARARFRSRD
ncbi:MAG: DUF3300 domain-containing protein [Pseudomonadales bacterium]